ncbi:cellulose synthase/poly-beta-1,6-N-acetylglucosamine synthase-like glycosyltransferase [Actinoplanes campanulatus]|uniref:Cellulose synthase/poly-beta-1,6-N-acetylglucosamine synthase-like glycosyltransferase n=1 Tax=Actinoplanes campanulatus TaxID=113559 RepID=A0A7W5AIG6_9ACTN|nr:glycosyltransferase family A protein [Actinoplanes campanulatus]MBB3096856.1 cellulose synthase/poly-beta-1,6-N-acetylglucosamine synthase-like glycosyltransferase [Actinoplanes campanulatus]GGN44563.1 transferase [Actinoplanes campanulatus]GID37400.1 transferase [Actinoplanes campanulatus]
MTFASIVVPTVGRVSLGALLAALGSLPPDIELLIVDDRADRRTPLEVPARVIAGRAAGPAAARNTGWRAAEGEWVAFLDDDVLPDPDWIERLADDLRSAAPTVGGVQGELRVPLPPDRPPTDWERVTAALADGEWLTADMAYRRAALARAGGFDERLPRAFREDAELALRVRLAGWELHRGRRRATHPVRPEDQWISVRAQRGNADDALLRRLYGPNWHAVLGIPSGRRHRHAVVTACLAAAAGSALLRVATGDRVWSRVAALAAAGWAAGTAEFAVARIAPGPRDSREVTTMLVTSAVIPPVAIAHWLRGWLRWRGAEPHRPVPEAPCVPLPDGSTVPRWRRNR